MLAKVSRKRKRKWQNRRKWPGNTKIPPEGTSKYPIKPGHVIKIQEAVWKRNQHSGRGGHHFLFVWIRSEHKKKVTDDSQENKLLVNYTYVPATEDIGTYFNVGKHIQIETLTKMYRKYGYVVLSDSCKYYGNNQSMVKYYKIIGLIK